MNLLWWGELHYGFARNVSWFLFCMNRMMFYHTVSGFIQECQTEYHWFLTGCNLKDTSDRFYWGNCQRFTYLHQYNADGTHVLVCMYKYWWMGFEAEGIHIHTHTVRAAAIDLTPWSPPADHRQFQQNLRTQMKVIHILVYRPVVCTHRIIASVDRLRNIAQIVTSMCTWVSGLHPMCRMISKRSVLFNIEYHLVSRIACIVHFIPMKSWLGWLR